jgi:predicted RNase H-like HicB family nuclease
MEMSIEIKVRFPVALHAEGDDIIAYIPLLNIASTGATKDEALANVVEALKVWVVSCYERGTLEAALKECGFHFSPQQDLPGHEPDDYVEVPLSLLAAARNGTQASAH